MSIFSGDASEVYKLAADLSAVGAKAVPVVRTAMQQAGDTFAQAWRSNATETAGSHGKHYPKSITAELAFSISSVSVDVGPESSMKQGGMGPGFEFGSRNQPPHLDGLHALDAIEGRVEETLSSAIGPLFP